MLHLHSILRWAVLALLLVALIKAVSGLLKKKDFTAGDGKIGLMLMIFTHIQLLLGISLYFMNGWATAPFAESMKDPSARFWKVEHIFAMLIVVTLITVGRIRSKKMNDSMRQHKTSLIYYGLALLIVLWAIPWEAARLF